ncbi:MAG: ribonuclease J [Candidatus Vogelbacteria bacterium]|nr:ribonuclease J [Candidatus Vogelbacteria bacterium]
MNDRGTLKSHIATEGATVMPPLSLDTIRIIPLGGVEEVGKNMTIVEYQDEIIVIDMGFQFPGEEAPGIDYIIPDTTYLQNKKKNIKGVFITHGHLDHIGGIPYIIDKLGNPPIYTRLLSSVMIKKRQDEFPHLPPLQLHVIEKDSRLRAGKHLSVRFFNVTHTIPDAMGVIVETPYGNIVFTGDLKIDHDNGVPMEHEVKTFEEVGRGNNLFMAGDSTNVERAGWSFSERAVHENLKKIMAETKGRLIMGTFASLLERVIFVIKTAEEMGKKVVLRGRSMKNNVEIAKELQILKVNAGTIITPEELDSYPPEKIIILATGAQGEELAALMRISTKKDKYIKMTKADTVLLSSSVIPGNERAVQELKDNISRQGASIIHYRIADVHSSGHANHDETLWIHKMIRPKFFMPLHGYHYMLRLHANIAKENGMSDENIVIPDNGMIIDIVEKGKKIVVRKETAPAGIVMVDGLGTGDVNDVVIRDRQLLAQDGMFVIIAIIDIKTGKTRQSPDIISRGFIYLKESQDLLRQTRFLIRKTIEDTTAEMHPVNFDYVKNNLREKVGKFLFQKTKKRPIVLPVLIEV